MVTMQERQSPLALIVDDDVNALAALSELVSDEGFDTVTATSLAEAREHIEAAPDIALLDLVLPDGNAMELFSDLRAQGNADIVLLTAHASIETSIEALRLGATDYVLKPINMAYLRGLLSRVSRSSDEAQKGASPAGCVREISRFGRLVGASAAMQKLYDEIGRVAPTGATILITGESGTGKELVAETIHASSRRKDKPFLAINCGAISPQLIESELFGHEKGSFTGAHRQHRGYFERANGGTLLLDEITEMPLDLQVKLLRVLETRTVSRIGSDQLIETDVRVIAATNRVPEQSVYDGKLRRDLMYRLQVFPLHVPPLRERLDDLTLLSKHFLAELNRGAATPKEFSPSALDRMRRYNWPGNVRELWNVVQRAYIMADGPVITTLGLGEESQNGPSDQNARSFKVAVGSTLADVEQKLILSTLQQCDTREEAAKVLGISVKTLYNRMRSYMAQ
jgi:two-component system response regulator AtoC